MTRYFRRLLARSFRRLVLRCFRGLLSRHFRRLILRSFRCRRHIPLRSNGRTRSKPILRILSLGRRLIRFFCRTWRLSALRYCRAILLRTGHVLARISTAHQQHSNHHNCNYTIVSLHTPPPLTRTNGVYSDYNTNAASMPLKKRSIDIWREPTYHGI